MLWKGYQLQRSEYNQEETDDSFHRKVKCLGLFEVLILVQVMAVQHTSFWECYKQQERRKQLALSLKAEENLRCRLSLMR